MADIKDIVRKIFEEGALKVAPNFDVKKIHIERPRNPAHGDVSTNIAVFLAKETGRKLPDVVKEFQAATEPALISEGITTQGGVSIALPFYNVRFAPQTRMQGIKDALEQASGYGRTAASPTQKIQVEFVSANPTGPLHVGHGRQAALGDAIAKLLESQGHQVTREFYYNDAGAQIDKLARSVQARAKGLKPGQPGWPEEGYAGEYIEDIAKEIRDPNDLNAIQAHAVAYLRKEQDEDLKVFGVKFDVYYLESSLYADGKVAETVKALVASGKTYEKDGALWLRTTDYGDDKDRVVRKSDGSYTYFVPDVAYHVTKWRRGFSKVIDVQGTDHHSTVTRVRAGLQAVGLKIPAGYPDYVLHSLVKVMRGGEEVKISKRAGSYVTVRDLIDWVGRDAVRFFLVSRKADTEFVFDIDLAREKTLENPVYYVQYAHARVCSVFAQVKEVDVSGAPLDLLTGDKELALARQLEKFPEVVSAAAEELAPHAIAFYLRELAAEFHSYYNAERILVDDEGLRAARLALCAAVRHTLANGLSLLGVSAPEKM